MRAQPRPDRSIGRIGLSILAVTTLILLLLFGFELLLDLSRSGVALDDLSMTPHQVQALASTVSRAFNNLMAMVLAFIALAIPITANMYTPKLIDIFVRDRINIAAMVLFSVFGAHAIFAQAMAYEQWTPGVQFTLCWVSGVVGFVVLVPYYFHVLSFLDPDQIIERVKARITAEYRPIRLSRRPVILAQRRLHARVLHLGNVLLRALSRSDRDVTLSSVRALREAVVRYIDEKREMPASWFEADASLFVGTSDEALAMIRADRVWVEQRCLKQLLLAYEDALAHVHDLISAITDVTLDIAVHARERGDGHTLDLCIRFFNTYLRSAIRKGDVRAVQEVLHPYKALARELLLHDAARALCIGRHFKYYAELARHERVAFVYEMIATDLAGVIEWAWDARAVTRGELLELFLSFDAQDTTVRMTTARAVLAGYMTDHGCEREAALVADRLYATAAPQVRRARKVLVGTSDPTFWEVTDVQRNLDYVEPARRATIARLLDDVLAKRERE